MSSHSGHVRCNMHATPKFVHAYSPCVCTDMSASTLRAIVSQKRDTYSCSTLLPSQLQAYDCNKQFVICEALLHSTVCASASRCQMDDWLTERSASLGDPIDDPSIEDENGPERVDCKRGWHRGL